MNALARSEGKGSFKQVNRLRSAAHEMHFDPALLGLVKRSMRESRKIEIGSQFAIGPSQQIKIEVRRHASGIVIGGLEPGAVLDEIDSDDERGSRAEDAGGEPKKIPCCLRVEISEGEAGEEPGPGRAARGAGQIEGPGEISRNRDNGQEWKLAAEARRLSLQELRGDVDRNISPQVRELFEQQ